MADKAKSKAGNGRIDDRVYKMRGFDKDKLRALREAKGWTQMDLRDAYMLAAIQLAVGDEVPRKKSKTTIANWESGVSEPEFTDVCILCQALDCIPPDVARYETD